MTLLKVEKCRDAVTSYYNKVRYTIQVFSLKDTERQRERETETATETERQRDRETERQREERGGGQDVDVEGRIRRGGAYYIAVVTYASLDVTRRLNV